ncbi:MAG: cation-translocating P-type ATPase, partial [Erysipelotrichaceae bacterium]
MFDNNENKKIKYYPNIEMGLTTEKVKERQLKGQVHHNTEIPTKSIKQIIWDNLFTLFNILNFGLGISILLVGSYKNLLFLGVVVCNILISVLQEIKAKKTVDKLSLFSETKVEVIRDGKSTILHAHEIVLDDIIKFNLGNQILVDSLVLRGD